MPVVEQVWRNSFARLMMRPLLRAVPRCLASAIRSRVSSDQRLNLRCKRDRTRQSLKSKSRTKHLCPKTQIPNRSPVSVLNSSHSLAHSLEIFLANSSPELVHDALDKLRHLTTLQGAFKALPFEPRIDLATLDERDKTLTIADTGIGMSEEDLISHLGTIARSGTKNFLSQLSGDAKKDSNLIGQFGVGFYSVFMVADSVEVITRKAGEDQAWRWTSDGKSGFDIQPAEREVARRS